LTIRELFNSSPSASAPKRDVVVMGNPAFANYQNSIQARIGNLNDRVKSLDRKIASLTERVRNRIGLPETQHLLDEHEAELKKTNRKISNLKRFSLP
jgi:RNase P protein component